jgi:RND family efflux transporter MFP subunit
MKRRLPWLIGLLAALLLAGWLWRQLAHEQPATTPAPMVVKTIAVQSRTMPRLIESSGRILPSQTAEIRAQASGILLGVHIRDGQRVEKGQPLFTVDAQPLRAALAQARASWARDEALATDAAETEARLKPLAAQSFVSAKDYQNARNTLQSLRASAAASRALVDEATIALGYAEVRAPIAGRAGAVLVKPGNLVSPAATTPLVVLNAATPADVLFALPQQQVNALRAAEQAAGASALEVRALDPADGRELGRGRLVFTDNAFDESSGTLGLKARFGNADETLWPGQFVTVRIVLGEDANSLTIPETAVQQGQQGPYVYAVRNGKAVMQTVTVVRLLDGYAVIEKGLTADDQVVLAVPNNLRDGTAITPAGGDTASTAGKP